MRRIVRSEIITLNSRKEHVDMNKAMYEARRLYESGEVVNVVAILGPNPSMRFIKKEVISLEKKLNKIYNIDWSGEGFITEVVGASINQRRI